MKKNKCEEEHREKIEIDEKVYEIQQIVRKISTRNNMTTFVVYLIPRD